MSKKNDKGRLPPFVPLLKETLATPAWRAMSHGARSLYVALRARYGVAIHNNGRLYLSQRTACREIGSGFNEVTRWFRELQHFGFIVQTSGGCLGVDGKGKAPHWRLTELGYMRDPPTRDFLKWDGQPFKECQKRRSKKQNPAIDFCSAPLRKTIAPVLRNPVAPNGTSAAESRSIQAGGTATDFRSISRACPQLVDSQASDCVIHGRSA
jgi:hypothetical protein